MPRIPFESLEIGFERLESISNGLNLESKASVPFELLKLHSNASNPFRMVRICIRIPRIPFERFEIGFESFESLSNDSNLHWNGSNPFEMVRMWFRKFRIPF